MAAAGGRVRRRAAWSLQAIDFDRIDLARARENSALCLLLISASFVESGADLYSGNLVRHYAGNPTVQRWLRDQWEPEELQHGRALRAYVCRLYPDLDWDRAFAGFFEEYAPLCSPEHLETSRCLEMAARCVVEMGTATLYQAIHDVSVDTVLRRLAAFIKRDEVSHYKHFYAYFKAYRRSESVPRAKVLGAVWRRLLELRSDDGDVGLWHAFHALHPGEPRGGAEHRRAAAAVHRLIRRNYPSVMAIKMLLKPLDLPAVLGRLGYALAGLAQRAVLR